MRRDQISRVCGVLLLLGPLLLACGRNVSSATSSPPVADAPPATRPAPVNAGLTLPPGQTLPNDATCAERVTPGAEIRPANVPFNQTRGRQKPLPGLLSRVSGNYIGTTDEIIQWAACKWGIDPDVVRAQAVRESSWFMTSFGDMTHATARCAPGHTLGSDGQAGVCPESVGILSVKYRYNVDAFPEAAQSTAYNLDYTLGVWRTCFEGQEKWLADQPPKSGYQAGDLWGCLGRWYAGNWRSDMALGYIDEVQELYRTRVWEAPSFMQIQAPPVTG